MGSLGRKGGKGRTKSGICLTEEMLLATVSFGCAQEDQMLISGETKSDF